MSARRFVLVKAYLSSMLKLYEKQLDVKMDIIDEADAVRQDRIT